MSFTVPFALFDAFSDTAFGGSQAGVVTLSTKISTSQMQKIAKEIGAPATSFVFSSGENKVNAQFLSTVMELPMCGHGTICLMTRMLEQGVVSWNGAKKINVELCLPKSTAAVEIIQRDDGRPQVMLDVAPPTFSQDELDLEILAALLGINTDDYSQHLPIETAFADFIHLVVPMKDLSAMRKITPDFNGLIKYCHQYGLETIATFCTEVEQFGYDLHVRDFCPAVGVPESAAAGTTNGALTSYLVRHKLIVENEGGKIIVQAEQGHEIERPSTIRSIVTMENGEISRLQVGGVATKVMDGQLHLSDEMS